MSGRLRRKGRGLCRGHAVVDRLALALVLEIRGLMNERGGQFRLGWMSD